MGLIKPTNLSEIEKSIEELKIPYIERNTKTVPSNGWVEQNDGTFSYMIDEVIVVDSKDSINYNPSINISVKLTTLYKQRESFFNSKISPKVIFNIEEEGFRYGKLELLALTKPETAIMLEFIIIYPEGREFMSWETETVSTGE